jgi:hypothetical protein
MRGMGAIRTIPARPAKPQGFFRVLWKAMRELFHEITGAVFFLMALSWANATFRLWRHGGAPHWAIGLASGFAVMLIAFGLTSFRAARRVR